MSPRLLEIAEWQDGIVLDSPFFQEIAGRIVVKGRTPEADASDSTDWSHDCEAGIAWDAVYYYLILPSDVYRSLRANDAGDDDAIKPKAKSLSTRLGVTVSLWVLGVFLPIALLVALVIWIAKSV